MARALRIEFEDAIYHISARGNRRERIFANDRDCLRFLELLSESLQRYQVELHGFVLLGNHFHLLVRTKRANLSRWMHWLLVTYVVYFNRRHRTVGHLLQGRYKALLVEGGEYLLGLSRYLHLNPVRGRAIGSGNPQERRARLRKYPWSSYRGYADLGKEAEFVQEDLVLGEMGVGRIHQVKLRYRRFVEEGLLREINNPVEAAKWQTVLGSETFARRVKDKMQALRQRRREVTALRRGTSGSSGYEVVAHVAARYKLSPERLLSGREYGLEARNVAMWAAWQSCGLSLREIGALFDGMDYAAVAQRIARVKRGGARKVNLSRLLKECQNI